MPPVIEFVNQKSTTKLRYDGHQYHKGTKYESNMGTIHYWVCDKKYMTDPVTKKRMTQCKALLHTMIEDGKHVLKKEPKEHTCEQMAHEKAQEEVHLQLREVAATSRDTPLHVIQNFKSGMTIQEMEFLPSDIAMTRTIQR